MQVHPPPPRAVSSMVERPGDTLGWLRVRLSRGALLVIGKRRSLLKASFSGLLVEFGDWMGGRSN